MLKLDIKEIGDRESGEQGKRLTPHDRREFREIDEASATSHLEVENIGLRRLVIELIEKNQRLREEVRLAKGECGEQESAA